MSELKQYTDQLLEDENWIIGKIVNESVRQVNKWGIQVRSAFEWLTYITEELGEMAEAISEHEYRNGSKEKVTSEAIQVATLALKIAEMFEKEDADEKQ